MNLVEVTAEANQASHFDSSMHATFLLNMNQDLK